MNRSDVRKLLSLLFAACILLATVLYEDGKKPNPSESAVLGAATSTAAATSTVEVATTTTNALVIRAVDGDTLDVKLDGSGDEVKVRLLGVNTPESVDPRKAVQCFGKEASHFTATATDGKRVRLDEDPQADEVDKYGRLLRNVVLSDGTDLNAALVREGYAHAYLSFPLNPYRKAELKRLESEARAAGRGLWNPETCNGKP